jgi:hypothetical protein
MIERTGAAYRSTHCRIQRLQMWPMLTRERPPKFPASPLATHRRTFSGVDLPPGAGSNIRVLSGCPPKTGTAIALCGQRGCAGMLLPFMMVYATALALPCQHRPRHICRAGLRHRQPCGVEGILPSGTQLMAVAAKAVVETALTASHAPLFPRQLHRGPAGTQASAAIPG